MTQGITAFIRIRATYSYFLYFRKVQRQRILLIFQQHQRLSRRLKSHFQVFFLLHLFISALQIGLIRFVKQSDQELDTKNIPYTVVNHFFTQPSFFNKFTQRQHIRVWRTKSATNIQSGLHTLTDSLFHILCRSMFGIQIFHGIAVRNNIPHKSPFTA